MEPNNGFTECYGCIEGNVTVNSCQIMDHAGVSQLHCRQIAPEAIATVTPLSYEEGERPDARRFVSSLWRRVLVRGTGKRRPTWGSVINLSPSALTAVAQGRAACLPWRATDKGVGERRRPGF